MSVVYEAGSHAAHTFTWLSREAVYENSLNLYRVDDAEGSIRITDVGGNEVWLKPNELEADPLPGEGDDPATFDPCEGDPSIEDPLPEGKRRYRACDYRKAAVSDTEGVFSGSELANHSTTPVTASPTIPDGWEFFSFYLDSGAGTEPKYNWYPFSNVNADGNSHFGGAGFEDLSSVFANTGGWTYDKDSDDMVLASSSITVDVNVDSNNDGDVNAATDDPETDRSFEQNGHGKILAVGIDQREEVKLRIEVGGDFDPNQFTYTLVYDASVIEIYDTAASAPGQPPSGNKIAPNTNLTITVNGLMAELTVYMDGVNLGETDIQFKATKEGGPDVSDEVQVTVALDLDTDSDNDGNIENTDTEEDWKEDWYNANGDGIGGIPNEPGKRIFANTDDDNQNGIPDNSDTKDDYSSAFPDDDFAEIIPQFTLFGSSGLDGYQLWLDIGAGQREYACNDKTLLTDMGILYAGGGLYKWGLGDAPDPPEWGVNYGGSLPSTVFIESLYAGNREIHWSFVSPGGTILARDTVRINGEKIVWPSNETEAADKDDPGNWASQNSANWNGFELGEAWEIDKSLRQIINGHDSDIRTRYPEKQSSDAWQGTDDYKTTTIDLPSGDFTVTVEYAFQEAPLGRTINNFADTTHDYIKPGFHTNSGIFIGQTEIQIFNSAALASLLDAGDSGGSVVLDGDPSATIYAYNNDTTKKVWLTESVGGPPPSDSKLSESYSALVNAIVYNKDGSTDVQYKAYDSNNVEVPLNTLNAVKNARMGGQIAIVVRPNAPVYKLEVTCSGVTYRYKALPATSTSADANKITLQSHWGSGVVFTNVSITED
jgi:hypothetical protein